MKVQITAQLGSDQRPVPSMRFLLRGPDGGNPLGFLCAVGTLRTATLAWPGHQVRMGWRQAGAGWRAELLIEPGIDEAALIDGLFKQCRYGRACRAENEQPGLGEAFPHFAFADNTSKIPPDLFREVALKAVQHAEESSGNGPERRAFSDFIAAFGCEACVDDGVVEDTALRTMSGSGHQHFLKTILNLAKRVTVEHIRTALCEPWRYQDPLANLSMRWDPNDLKRYALQWGNPSTDPTRAKQGSVLGANRLAVEALPLFVTAPVRKRAGRPRLATTCFEFGASEPHFTWPIWTDPVTLDVCASLLAHPALSRIGRTEVANGGSGLDPRYELEAIGVKEVFRSRRISVDYYRNFTSARAI